MKEFIYLLIFSYFLGSFPTGYLISKIKGIDIRKVGSGATGLTNVSRILGWKWSIIVGLVDFLKGFISVLIALKFLKTEWQIASVILMVIIGHVFPLWISFKGGKGVAPLAGALLGLLGGKFFLILFFLWLLLLLISRIMSVTNLLFVLSLPFIFWFTFQSLAYLIFGIILIGFIYWTHRENIKRIIEKREPGLNFKL